MYRDRYDLTAPCVRSGCRYATNGIIVVAVPAPGEPDTERDYPDAAAVIMRPAAELLLPWPTAETPPPEEVVCSLCNGILTCPTCNQPCPDCHGMGKIFSSEGAAELGPQTYLNRKWFRLVASLPGEKKWYQPQIEPGHSLPSVYFSFEGGEGAAVPMLVDRGPAGDPTDANSGPPADNHAARAAEKEKQ
jgi:hypothetical protein